jgi:hypothetical protein
MATWGRYDATRRPVVSQTCTPTQTRNGDFALSRQRHASDDAVRGSVHTHLDILQTQRRLDGLHVVGEQLQLDGVEDVRRRVLHQLAQLVLAEAVARRVENVITSATAAAAAACPASSRRRRRRTSRRRVC